VPSNGIFQFKTMNKFKHLVYDGYLDELDVPVKNDLSWPWTPIPECPSTIDPDVTVEDIVEVLEEYFKKQRIQYDLYKDSLIQNI